MAFPVPKTKCEICGTETDTSFTFVGILHYHCKEHGDALFTQVTGKAPKKTPKHER
jgi:hypothetical protein